MKVVNAVVVDTSTWISYFDKRQGSAYDLLDIALSEGRVFLPPLVVAELLSGQFKASLRSKLIDFLQELPLCQSSLDHWIRVGLLRSRLSERGYQISTPDAHIAQSAIDLNAILLSEDAIFKKVSDLCKLKILA